MACASTVAVVVPSPATSLVLEAASRTICAPMFSRGSCSSISLATVPPYLVMIGAPNFFSITALRPLGPRVIFTASARTFTPRRIAWREFSPVTICFAILVFPPDQLSANCEILSYLRCHISGHGMPYPYGLKLELPLCGFGCAAQLGENLFFSQNEELVVV